MATQPLEAPCAGTVTQPVQAPGSVPDVQPACEGDLSAASDRVTSKVLLVPCLTSTTGTGPQTETSPGKRLQIRNFERRPATERQCEVSEALWVGTRFQSLKLCPHLMTTLLPVYVSNLPVKCLWNYRLMTGYAGRRTSLTSPSQRGTLQEILILPVSSKINLSSHPSHLDGMGCMLKGETVTDCVHLVSGTGKLNHPFSRVARRSFPSAPPSRAFSQDMLRRWERTAHEQTLMCNQAAGLSRCLTRVQDAMSTQRKSLHLDTKGKSSENLRKAVDELDYLVTFNR